MDKNDAKQKIIDFYADKKELQEAMEADEPPDVISEIADSNVEVYTYNLLKWLPDNYEYVEDAISEFGFPERDGKPDMIKAIMQGQYQQNSEALWEAWEEIKEENK